MNTYVQQLAVMLRKTLAFITYQKTFESSGSAFLVTDNVTPPRLQRGA